MKQNQLACSEKDTQKIKLFSPTSSGKSTSFDEVKEVIREELCGSGSILGYRRLWSHLKTSGVLVRREDVRLALLELDPENVDKRRRRRLRRRNITARSQFCLAYRWPRQV